MADAGDNLPDEDFEALNAEGDEEEDDDQPVEGYDTEDEAPPVVRPCSIGRPPLIGWPVANTDNLSFYRSLR